MMDFAAFPPGVRLTKGPIAAGPIAFGGQKDLFDVEGSVTGCGNPRLPFEVARAPTLAKLVPASERKLAKAFRA
jgi:hypothetical protein